MGKKLFAAVVITTGVLAVAFGTFSVLQSLKCFSLEGKVSSLETQNKNLSEQIQTLNSKLEKAETSETAKIPTVTAQGTVQTNDESSDKADEQAQTLPQTNGTPTTPADIAGKKTAFLTFDDGPSYNTSQLLDILKQNKVKATFFVIAQSKDTPERRALMKREVDEGHTIGIHSWSHNYNYIYASESNFFDDFNKMKNMIVSATGVEPKFSRFPGGTDNTVSLTINKGKPIMPKILQDVLKGGTTPVDWNVGGMDAVIPVPSKDTIVKDIVDECRYRKSAIILLHDSEPHASSVAAVPEIIKQLRAMGYTFEPITSASQVMRRNPATAIKSTKK